MSQDLLRPGLFTGQSDLFGRSDLFGPAPAGGGTVTFVDSDFVNNESGTAPPVLKPAGAEPGDLLIGHFSSRALTTFTPPSGWTALGGVDHQEGASGNAVSLDFFYRVVEVGDPSSWTASISPGRWYGTGVIALRGADADSIGTFSTDFGGGSALNYPSVTVEDDDSILVGLTAAVVDPSIIHPSGTTEHYDFGSASSGRACGNGWTVAADAGASGAFSGTASGSASGNSWATALIPVKPAA